MAQNETWLNHDMLEAVRVQYLDGNLFSMDNAGNLIGVNLTRDGVDYSGGGSVSANVIRADGSTVSVVGALSGNVATVVLPQAAYAVPGVASIVIKLTVSGEVTTIAAVVANVYQASTDSVVDPGTIIPSVQALISAIESAVASIPADYSSLWASLAPAFSTSTNYTAGQYVTYNGALYRFTTDHSAGAWNSAQATATNIGADVNDLKSAFMQDAKEATGNEIIDSWEYGGSIPSNTSPVDMSNVIENSAYRYTLIECSAGDLFTLNIYCGNTAQAWNFLDSSYNVLSQPGGAIDAENLLLQAPTGTKYLLLNDRNTYKPFRNCYFGKLLSEKFADVQSILNIQASDFVIGLPNGTESNTRIFTKSRIALKKGTIISLIGNPYCLYVHGYDTNNNVIKDYSWSTYNNRVEVEDDGYYTIVIRKSTENETIASADIAEQVRRLMICGESFEPDLITNDDLNTLIGNKIVQGWNYGYCIVSNTDPVDITNISFVMDYRNLIIECSAGDIFTVSVHAGNTARGWSFLDTNYGVLSQASGAVSEDALVIVAPPNTKYLLLNDRNNVKPYRNSYYGTINPETNLPYYWESDLIDELDKINILDAKIGFDGTSFVFLTDIHYPNNTKKSPELIREIIKGSAVRKVVCGGDIINSYYDNHDAAILEGSAWQKLMSGNNPVTLFGNHEALYQNASEADFYGIYCRPVEESVDFAKPNHVYGYRDDNAQKIRMIFLNTKGSSVTMGSAQLTWFKERLTELESGWKVIVFAHKFFTVQDRQEWTAEAIIWDDNGTAIEGAINEVIGNMSAKIIAIISGHCHYDYSETSANGYPIIATTCDAYGQQITIQGQTPLTRTPGTVSEQAFDVVHIDTSAKKVYMTRIGAGNDREFSYT